MTKKTIYVTQGHYGQGWEDLTASDTRSGAKDDLRDYDVNEPQYPHRIVVRREES